MALIRFNEESLELLQVSNALFQNRLVQDFSSGEGLRLIVLVASFRSRVNIQEGDVRLRIHWSLTIAALLHHVEQAERLLLYLGEHCLQV